MESLRDDELLTIFNKIDDVRDRMSFYQVSKQFLRVACTGLRELHIKYPDLLKDVLTISPNMVRFTCLKSLPNTSMELLARSCPNLGHLTLICYSKISDFDFDDDGLCAVAKACSHLSTVEFYGRLHIGDVGVDCLIRSCKDLGTLSLRRCARVTDESLKFIGELNSLQKLDLGGCLISDLGLEYMTKGDLKNSLIMLYLDECDKISDIGICHLKQMVNLTHLSLYKCGVNITDSGILALSSQIPNIKWLRLPWLINVTDISLSQIASNCKKLKYIKLTGCKDITGKGVRCFAHHPTLECLDMSECYNIVWKDVESIASTCRNLRELRKDGSRKFFVQGKRLKIWWFY